MSKLTLADRLAMRSPQAALARARHLKDEGQHERAFKLFTIAAGGGLSEAQREVGGAYLSGAAGLRNPQEAGRWLARAAASGDIPAQTALAGLYAGGYHPTQAQGGTLFADAAPATEADADIPPDFETALRWALSAAEAGDADAQTLAGFIYAIAPPPLRDEDKAIHWYGKAAASGKAQGHLGLGVLTLSRATTDEPTFAGVAHIRQAAEANLPNAHLYLAIIYERAIGVHADLALAAYHYGLAAEGGIRHAMAKYGFMLFEGIGVKMNKTVGETWLRRAGLAGDPEAAVVIGNLYAHGDGTLDPNFSEAALWFRIAADKGHAEAARALGMLYLTGAGVTRDSEEAALWFRKSAEAGNTRAQADLAALLLKHQDDPRFAQAAPVHDWFEQAAAAGDPVGAYNYAVCLAEGVGLPRDDAKAAEWFRKAAETVVNAQYRLGRIYAEGRGVQQDFAEARLWMKQAAAADLPAALMDYATLLLQGLGGERDDIAATQLMERAAGHHGIPEAMFALGALYGGGHQIPTDRAKSLQHYRAAAEKGHGRAALMLGKYLRFGIATAVDLDEARKWFAVAAGQGVEEARAELAALAAPEPEPAPEPAPEPPPALAEAPASPTAVE